MDIMRTLQKYKCLTSDQRIRSQESRGVKRTVTVHSHRRFPLTTIILSQLSAGIRQRSALSTRALVDPMFNNLTITLLKSWYSSQRSLCTHMRWCAKCSAPGHPRHSGYPSTGEDHSGGHRCAKTASGCRGKAGLATTADSNEVTQRAYLRGELVESTFRAGWGEFGITVLKFRV
jgi:hypothetical protein